MFWIQGGSQIRGLEICVADLILLVISEQTFYLDKVKFINFFLSWITLLTLNLRNLCLTQGHKVFLFSSKRFILFYTGTPFNEVVKYSVNSKYYKWT